MARTSVKWYYMDGDQRQGPVGTVKLKNLIKSGAVTRATLVWRDGASDWTEAGQTELGASFGPEDCTPPPPTGAADDPQAPQSGPQEQKPKRFGLMTKDEAVIFLVIGVIGCLCGFVHAGAPVCGYALWSLVTGSYRH